MIKFTRDKTNVTTSILSTRSGRSASLPANDDMKEDHSQFHLFLKGNQTRRLQRDLPQLFTTDRRKEEGKRVRTKSGTVTWSSHSPYTTLQERVLQEKIISRPASTLRRVRATKKKTVIISILRYVFSTRLDTVDHAVSPKEGSPSSKEALHLTRTEKGKESKSVCPSTVLIRQENPS